MERAKRGSQYLTPHSVGRSIDKRPQAFYTIGQAIYWPCLQRDANGNPTLNLKPGSPCARARALLNKLKT